MLFLEFFKVDVYTHEDKRPQNYAQTRLEVRIMALYFKRISVIFIAVLTLTAILPSSPQAEVFQEELDIQFVETLSLGDGDLLDTLYIVEKGGTVSIEPGATLTANGGGIICLGKDALLSDSLSVIVKGTGKKRFFGLRFPFAENLNLEQCKFSDLRLMPAPPLEILNTMDSREKFIAHFRASRAKGLATAVEALRIYADDSVFKGLSYGITEALNWHESKGGEKWTCVPRVCAVNAFEVILNNCRVESTNFAVGGDLSFSAMFLAQGLPKDLAVSDNAENCIRNLTSGSVQKHMRDTKQSVKVACPPKIDPVTMRVSEKAERPGGSK
ncbi:MAG: hypothetical protein U5N86_14025 [Planctomycetota bacterium]|nr:hypothetical protein [Planctomycetota bacterium]